MDSNSIAVRVSDFKPGVMYQTQTTGIQFSRSVQYATGDCPKCGHSNSGIYFPNLKTRDGESETTMHEYLKTHGAEVRCCQCGIPYRVKVG